MRIAFKLCAIVLVVAVFSACAGKVKNTGMQAAVEPVLSQGVAPFNEKDLAATTNMAVMDAQRSAITSVADVFFDAQARAEKYESFRQGLLQNPSVYIKKYKVLQEKREGDFYRVNIKAYVHVDKVVSALKGLSMSTGSKPKLNVVLMMQESFKGEVSKYGDARGAFLSYMKRAPSMEFLDVPAAEGNALFDSAVAAGAEMVFISKAEASLMGADQAPQSGFLPVRARAELKIYEAVSKKLLLDLSSQANALDQSQEAALRKSLVSAGELLAQEVLLRSDKLSVAQTPFKLRVRNLPGIDAVGTLKTAVEKLGVDRVTLESYAEGEAVFALYLKKGDPQEFSSALLRAGVFNMELEGVSQFEAVFSLI